MVSKSKADKQRAHLINGIEIYGGFLDGLKLDLAEGLNCVIGPRGAGKTTILEFVRYALGGCTDNSPRTRSRLESLIKSNLGGGRVDLRIQTHDGLNYLVTRSFGDEPLVLDRQRNATGISLRGGGIFDADIFSQNEVENIASDACSQLVLLDNIARREIRQINQRIRELESELALNAQACAKTKKTVDRLSEEIKTLPVVDEKLKSYKGKSGRKSNVIDTAHNHKALRDRERRVTREAVSLLKNHKAEIADLRGKSSQRVGGLFAREILNGPNGAIMREMRDLLAQTTQALDDLLQEAAMKISDAEKAVKPLYEKLAKSHDEQEAGFQVLLEKHKQAQEESSERAALMKKRNDLMVQKRQLTDYQRELDDLGNNRQAMMRELSDLRDSRYQTRAKVATRINGSVEPDIRVQVQMFGDCSCYQRLLEDALKNAGVQHKVLAKQIASRVPPEMLVAAVNANDAEELINSSQINASQARKVIDALGRPETLYAVETAELIDQPRIELRVNGEYRDSLALSTGQKCTTILPIVLLDSVNPLLVDQPEDNLDNRFVFTTVVKRIMEVKKRRQLIFVTHNPNIPVLADAERVFVLGADGGRGQVVKSGTVDECRDEIVTLLEGGEEAFKQRGRRYSC